MSGSRPRSTLARVRVDPAHKVALPLHPEFRTVPMVWYIPPLSPVVDAVSQ